MTFYLSLIRNNLVKETFLYTFTDVLGKAMSFILLPILSFYLPPDELGIATNFTVLTSLIILLAGLAIVNSLPYFYYEQSREANALLITNLIILCSFLCVVLFSLDVLFQNIVCNYFLLPFEIQLLSILYVFGSLLTQLGLIILRLDNKPKDFCVFQLLQIALHVIAVVFFVVCLNGGAKGKIYAEVIVFLLMGILHLILIVKKRLIVPSLSFIWIRKLLKFGLPLLPHSISFWLKSGVDKIIITTYCGLHLNGIYSMAITIGSIYTMLVQSFFNAYTPYLQKILSKVDNNNVAEMKKIIKQTYFIIICFLFVSISCVLFSYLIIEFLIDEKYHMAMDFIPLIAIANFVYTFYNFFIQYIYKAKKTICMGIITFTSSIVQMVLSYLFIRFYGVIGAAYSLVIGNIIVTIGISLYSNYVYPMPWFKFNYLVRSNENNSHYSSL